MNPLLSLSLAELQQFFVAAIPHNHHLGMKIVRCSEGGLVIEMPFNTTLSAPSVEGSIHEGAITTLIDTTCGSAVLTRLVDFRRTATLDLRIDFLRKARAGHAVHCEAECVSVGKDVAVVRAVAYDDQAIDPIAVATGTFAIFKGRPDSPILSNPAIAVNSTLRDETYRLSGADYAGMMGVDSQLKGDVLVGHMAFGAFLVGNPALKALHGGAVGSLLQLTAEAELNRHMESRTSPRIFDVTIEYLNAASPADTFARARIVTRSRRFANIRVFAYQDDPDKHVAAATVQFLLAS